MVTFYALDKAGNPDYPVLFLDTLKVSTIEQTAENTDARGGKGNAALISWDYNKEINVTLEDALFSARSLAIMFGDGTTKSYAYPTGVDVANATKDTKGLIMRTEYFTSTDDADLDDVTGANSSKNIGWSKTFTAPDGKTYTKIAPKFYAALDGSPVTDTNGFVSGTEYFCTYDLKISGIVIDVSANSFPGTYYITGDTFARNEKSGKDDFFQFIIPKAKVTSENTITLEAEGDPSVFNMSLKVLRPVDGVMMKLVKYNLEDGTEAGGSTPAKIYHNHSLDGAPASDGSGGLN